MPWTVERDLGNYRLAYVSNNASKQLFLLCCGLLWFSTGQFLPISFTVAPQAYCPTLQAHCNGRGLRGYGYSNKTMHIKSTCDNHKNKAWHYMTICITETTIQNDFFINITRGCIDQIEVTLIQIHFCHHSGEWHPWFNQQPKNVTVLSLIVTEKT